MALGGTYNTGFVRTTNASAAVTGVGVLWSDVVEGDWLQVGAAIGVIDSVSGTFDGITLKDKWAGLSDPVITVTIASPAVVSLTAHGKVAGDPVAFFTTGALPTGLVAGITYYVIAAGLTANAFEVSATLGGSAINTSGSQSGVHTIAQAYRILKMSWLRYDPALTQQKLRQFINVIETAALFGVPFAWDTGTSDADPGAGNIRANNASLASATTLYISKTSRAGADVSAFLAALDASTTTSNKGTLILGTQPDGTQAIFITGVVTDATNYIKLAIYEPSGVTSFLSGALINFQFTRTGDVTDVTSLFSSPPPLGDTTPNTGAFTTLGIGNYPPTTYLDVFAPNGLFNESGDGPAPLLANFAHGSNANPVTDNQPSVSISRTEAITGDAPGGENAALSVLLRSNGASGAYGSIGQGNAIKANAVQTGHGDIVAVMGAAYKSLAVGDGSGAYGGYFTAVGEDGADNTSIAVGTGLFNNTGVDIPFSNGASVLSTTFDAVAQGNNLSASVINARNGGAQFDVLLGINGSSVKTAIISNYAASVSLWKDFAAHTDGIDLSGATFSGDAFKSPGFYVDPAGMVSTQIIANASIATAMSSVGPTGSHTTVQEWFKIKNPSGTVRYVPGF